MWTGGANWRRGRGKRSWARQRNASGQSCEGLGSCAWGWAPSGCALCTHLGDSGDVGSSPPTGESSLTTAEGENTIGACGAHSPTQRTCDRASWRTAAAVVRHVPWVALGAARAGHCCQGRYPCPPATVGGVLSHRGLCLRKRTHTGVARQPGNSDGATGTREGSPAPPPTLTHFRLWDAGRATPPPAPTARGR